MKSWRTTTCGIGGIATIIGGVLTQLTDGNPNTNPDWNIVVPMLFTSIAPLFARDHKVTSEQAGLNPAFTPIKEMK